MKSLRDARKEYMRACRRERRGKASYREATRRLEVYRNLYNARHPPSVFRLHGIDQHGNEVSDLVTVPAFGGAVVGKIPFRSISHIELLSATAIDVVYRD